MRIGVIGLGFMGTTHLKAWRGVSNAQLAAVCSDDPAKLTGDLSAVQGNLGGPGERFDFTNVSKYSRVRDLLADSMVDAVDICLPTHLHAEAAVDALRAGKHVLLEKPMALTAAAAEQVLQEAKGSSRVFMVAHVLRFFPPYRALVTEIASQAYGSVRNALFRRRCAAPFWSQWLGDRSKSGGGVFDLLIHDVDFCLKLFGAPESVSATGYRDDAAGVDVISANLYYDGGPAVLITGGWHHRLAYPFSMEYTVTADGATFEFNFLRDEALIYQASGEAKPLQRPAQDGFQAELQYFVDCCESRTPPEYCPPEQSAMAVQLMLAIDEARGRNGEKMKWRS